VCVSALERGEEERISVRSRVSACALERERASVCECVRIHGTCEREGVCDDNSQKSTTTLRSIYTSTLY